MLLLPTFRMSIQELRSFAQLRALINVSHFTDLNDKYETKNSYKIIQGRCLYFGISNATAQGMVKDSFYQKLIEGTVFWHNFLWLENSSSTFE